MQTPPPGGRDARSQARADSDERLQLAMRAVNVGLWDWDLRTNEVYYSSQWKRQIGYEDHEIPSDFKEWQSRVHPAEIDAVLAGVRAYLEQPGADYRTEFRFRHKDGSYRWILAQGAVARDERGRPIRFLGAHVDITARREAEEALQVSEETHRLTLENISDTVLITDDAGALRYVCPNVAVIFGRSPAAVMSLGSIEALLGPGLFDPAELERRKELPNIERTITRADGVARTLFVNVKRVSIRGGTVLYTCRDVSERKRAEDSLRRSEELFRAIVEDQTEMIVRWKPDGTCTFVNQAYCNAVNRRPAELLDSVFLPAAGEGGREAIERRASLLTPDRPVATFYHESALPSGKTLCEEWTDRGLFDAEGRLAVVQSTGRDITERRRAEVRIRQLNRVYAVLSNINETIVREGEPPRLFEAACRIAVERGGFLMSWIGMVDSATGKLGIAAHAGATPDTLAVIRSLFEDPQRGCAFTTHTVREGERAVCNNIALDLLSAPWRDEALQRGYRALVVLPLKVKDELVGTFSLYAGEAGFFDEEELKLLDELALDIGFALQGIRRETERGRAEAARRESEERFRQLTESIQDVFWISDPVRNEILYLSPAYEAIWGRTRESLYAAPGSWQEAVHPEDRSRTPQGSRHPFGSGNSDEEYRIIRPDGEVRWIRDRAFPVLDENGRVTRVVGVARDVTERRDLEEQFRQAQKMEAIGQLAGGVAHDFNNILAAILMQTELVAMDQEMPERIRAELLHIRAYAERAANLTRQLLLFSRRQVMQRQVLDLNEVVTNLAQMLRRIIGEDVRLVLNLSSAPLMINADAGMLDQVLLNLSVNSRDAMPGGGQVVIETAAQTVDDHHARLHSRPPGRYVSLAVTDTGKGIAPEVLPRIFEPFFTTKEEGRGTGLGLATVFGIVEQHRGWITAESEPGRGTTMRVYLPAIEMDQGKAALPAVQPAPRGGTETILVVEDEQGVRLLIRAVLERNGYRVLEAANGDGALQLWQRQGEAALLLTDLVMPGELSGQELARQLQARNPRLKVVFISGYSADLAGRELELHAGENFLQKPFGPNQLLETIRRCLDG